MANKSILRIGVLSGFLLAIPIPARTAEKPPETVASPSPAAANAGILTDRLSRKQLSLWHSLMKALQATDASGIPLYPKLHSLWQAATSGGHAICIELPEKREGMPVNAQDSFCTTAGKFIRPMTDREGHLQPAVIRLYRSTIDCGVSDPWEDGFQPFRGLGRDERYLEVLGHELAHAVAAFNDREYAEKIDDLEREIAGFPEFWRRHRKMPESAEEMRRRAHRIGTLTRSLETPARAAEVEVWRELSLKQSADDIAVNRTTKPQARTSQGK